jgi:hypothetical protein
VLLGSPTLQKHLLFDMKKKGIFMADQILATNQGSKWMRIVARILATLWFGFWAFFGIASGIGEGGSNFVFHLIFPTLICAVLLFIVWRWESVGSIIMIAFGLLFAIVYPFWASGRLSLASIIPTELVMVLPLLISGILLILYRGKLKASPVKPIED